MEGLSLKFKRKSVLIRVFSGGIAGVQVQPFATAISATLDKHRSHINIIVEYLSTSQLRTERMTPNNLVDWLLASDVHIFLSHAHQSIVEWDCRDITDAYWRLVAHNGFPSGLGLFCNIFLQNKYGYLDCMGDFCNKSVKVRLPSETSNRVEMLAIIAKLPSEGKGIVVKTPFTTNCEFFKICHNIEQVFIDVQLLLFSLKLIDCFLIGRSAIDFFVQKCGRADPLCNRSNMHGGKARGQSGVSQYGA